MLTHNNHMEHNLTTLRKEFREKALTETERRALKARLVVFMHDLPPAPARWFSFAWASHTSVFRLTPVIVIALFFVGGGVSRVAESSIPGDILYGFKTGVNEEIKGFLATSPESAAAFEVDLAERRVSELERMVVAPSPEPVIVPAQTSAPESFSAPAAESFPEPSLMMMQTDMQAEDRSAKAAPSPAPTPTPSPAAPATKVEKGRLEKDAKQKKKEEAAVKLDMELQVRIERAEEKLQKLEASQGETEVVVKAREKLRKVNERREKTKSGIPAETTMLMITAPAGDASDSPESSSKGSGSGKFLKNRQPEEIRNSARQEDPTNQGVDATMMMQVAPAATTSTPALRCIEGLEGLTGKAYLKERVVDLKEHLSKYADSFDKKYIRDTEKKLSSLEGRIAKLLPQGLIDLSSALHKDIATLELELVGVSCPERP